MCPLWVLYSTKGGSRWELPFGTLVIRSLYLIVVLCLSRSPVSHVNVIRAGPAGVAGKRS